MCSLLSKKDLVLSVAVLCLTVTAWQAVQDTYSSGSTVSHCKVLKDMMSRNFAGKKKKENNNISFGNVPPNII